MPIFENLAKEPKWSFVATDDIHQITEVRAKDPFTTHAVVGIYYFRTVALYQHYAAQMVAANKRVNGEFYVCPVYNELITDNRMVLAYPVEQMVGLGTPEDYEAAKNIL